jgi:dTDP-4-dehydrorhamnose reductase
MRVLVVGGTGQLGRDLVEILRDDAHLDVLTAARSGADFIVDLANPTSLREVLEGVARPQLIINTAAAHNVPACESNPEEAWRVNATGVAALAHSSARIGARLVHISTDYVFGAAPRKDPSGQPSPWREQDLPAPLNVYGTSKLAGEHLLAATLQDHVIVRSSGLYGRSPCLAKGGRNFVQQMLHLGAERGEVSVVTDEILTPTSSVALARQIRAVALCEARGTFHATCQGECSWHEFAKAIFEEMGQTVSVLPATSTDFPSAVRRPAYSVLENERLKAAGIDCMPAWREALRTYLASTPEAP